MTVVSLTLTLSGGAALGAYEAGATAGIMAALHELRDRGQDVTVDAYGGASAGALVAMFAAHAQANDIDPVWLLREAWVERVSLDLLSGGGSGSPLGFRGIVDGIGDILDPRDAAGAPARRHGGSSPPHPVGLHVALTGLRGLRYQIRGLGALNPVLATTYADWGGFTLEPHAGAAGILEPSGRSVLEFALASAANPVAFPPHAVDRSPDAEGYASNGIEDLPESGLLWYTDGGTLQVEPIGRVLTAARKARESAGLPPPDRHVTLLVDPRSELPSADEVWSRDRQPSWLQGIARTLEIIPAQILYDDLRRVQKMNSRLLWAERLSDTLAPHLSDEAKSDLASALRDITGQLNDLRVGTDPDNEVDIGGSDDAGDLLTRALSLVGGLDRKHVTEADVISPLLLADGDQARVSGLLAGEILGDFGGFLSADLRASDFVLGYDCALAWVEQNLPRMGLEAHAVETAIAAARTRLPEQANDANRGSTQLRDLPLRARLRLVRLALRMAGALARDALGGMRSS